MKKVFLLLSFMTLTLFGNEVLTSNHFKEIANFVFNPNFDPRAIEKGDIIYVDQHQLEKFLDRYHHQIAEPYILLTHGGDQNFSKLIREYIDDPKLLKWFSSNITTSHPKLIPIPIGLPDWTSSGPDFDVFQKQYQAPWQFKKRHLLYLNFEVSANFHQRYELYIRFMLYNYCKVSNHKDYNLFLADLAESQFVISPQGKTLDTSRVWETLYMGSIPVVKSSIVDSLYEGLPVVIVDRWDQLTEDYLLQKYTEFESGEFSTEKLYMAYWEKFIKDAQ